MHVSVVGDLIGVSGYSRWFDWECLHGEFKVFIGYMVLEMPDVVFVDSYFLDESVHRVFAWLPFIQA